MEMRAVHSEHRVCGADLKGNRSDRGPCHRRKFSLRHRVRKTPVSVEDFPPVWRISVQVETSVRWPTQGSNQQHTSSLPLAQQSAKTPTGHSLPSDTQLTLLHRRLKKQAFLHSSLASPKPPNSQLHGNISLATCGALTVTST